jgi:hypothetical protein
MKLKDYVASLAKLAEQYPDAEVVSASDDEGNNFQKVNYDGTMGYFVGDYHGDFFSVQNVEKYPNEEAYEPFVGKKPNAICIN